MKPEIEAVLMFIVIMFLGILAMHYAVVLWTSLNMPKLNYKVCGARVLLLLPLLLSLAFTGCMYLTRVYEGGFAGLFRTAVYVWLGALFLWFALVALVIIIQFALAVLKIRLAFSLAPLVTIAAIIISVLSFLNAARTPAIKNINLISAKISQPITVAQISDSHLGDGVCAERLKKLFDKITAQNPDIVVFTGDIFERGGGNMKEYTDIIKAANPKHGKFAVLGNHEYYGGVERNLELWRQSEITPIINGSIEAGGINIVGVNDIKTARMGEDEFIKIVKNSDTSKFTLLLSHTPLYYDAAARAGVDLMLSGHTHNGQLWPFNLLVATQFKHTYGAYKDENSPFVHYVTSGAFYWGPPMRFLTYNEVPIFKIIPQ